MTFSDKIKFARERAGMTQAELGKAVGVSQRAIAAYESQGAIARRGTTAKLAGALRVSVRYLTDESCTDPMADIEKDCYVEQIRSLYGSKDARDMQSLLEANQALFAGGDLSQEQKDVFFEAVMRAYIACKEESRKRNAAD